MQVVVGHDVITLASPVLTLQILLSLLSFLQVTVPHLVARVVGLLLEVLLVVDLRVLFPLHHHLSVVLLHWHHQLFFLSYK